MMLRPGGFIEYSPKEQQIFDILHKTIEQTFQQYGYQHIHTPAVEKVDTLKKGGDEVSKQIFGLYGLAQGSEDTKDYALHFDLTIPFARYTLDRQNDLAFPFKRYQIQPVWRGERSQKGRYKEFRQADIDVIWKTEDDKGYNAIYDADIITTLSLSIKNILETLGINKKITVRVSNRKFVKGFIEYLAEQKFAVSVEPIIALFDKYHKLPEDKFIDGLKKIGCTSKGIEMILDFLKAEIGKDVIIDKARKNKNYEEGLNEIVSMNKKLDLVQKECNNEIIFEVDPSIVRGLDYYTGTVFETFIEDRKDIGSICSGGSYANLTEFMDTKQSFSGIGGSIGLSRLMSVLLEEYNITESYQPTEKSYLILHEEQSRDKAQKLVSKLRKQGYIAEIYPTAEKTDKQFKYAEKKGVSHVIQFFDDTAKVKALGGQREDLSVD